MKKTLILGIAVLLSPYNVSQASKVGKETTHDVRMEIRDLGKGADGKQIIHYKPIAIQHAKNGKTKNNQFVEDMLKSDANASQHDVKVKEAKPSFHNVRIRVKTDPEGSKIVSSEVVNHEDTTHSHNEAAATLFSLSSLATKSPTQYGPNTGIVPPNMQNAVGGPFANLQSSNFNFIGN